ncbi:MAG: O-antigen ligase family protein [Oleiphilaceae bacterium]|nr:O-antigen ligase family protein [Oleiphilaceae bacterium]
MTMEKAFTPTDMLLRALVLLLSILTVGAALLIEPVSAYGGYADQRIILVLLMWLLVPLLLLPGGVRLQSCLMAGWGLFVLSIALSTGLDVAHPSAVVEAVFYPAYLAAIAALVFLFRASGQGQFVHLRLLEVAVVAMFLYALIAVMIYGFVLLDGLKSQGEHLPWGFYNIRYWNQTATWLLPLLPLAVLVGPMRQHRHWRLMMTFTAAVWWWLTLLSMGRGSIMGMLMALLVMMLVFGRVSFPWARAFAGYLLLGILLWFILSWLLPMIILEESALRPVKSHSSGRMPLWLEAWQMSLQKFPLGMGPQSWSIHEPLTEAYGASRRFGHPHNMYLMWAAEFGWLSLCGLFAMGCVACRRLWGRRKALFIADSDSESGLLLCGFTASVVAALLHAGVSAVFIGPASMLLGLVIMASFWLLLSPGDEARPVTNNKSVRLWRAILMAIVFSGMSVWVYQVWVYHEAIKEQLLSDDGYTGGLKPGFWLHGDLPWGNGSAD